MKSLIKSWIIRIYYFLFEKRILKWIDDDKIQNFKNNLLHSGNNLNLCFPLRSCGLEYISIGDNFSTLSNLRLEAVASYPNQKFTPELIIGDNVSLQQYCHIGCINKIVIGDGVLIASGVFITDHFHGETTQFSGNERPEQRKLISKGPVIIGKNVWIGQGACIMPNVTIGDNCIIGSNSVVTKNFPKNSVIAGVPAVIINSF